MSSIATIVVSPRGRRTSDPSIRSLVPRDDRSKSKSEKQRENEEQKVRPAEGKCKQSLRLCILASLRETFEINTDLRSNRKR
jgi:hypothetical protein